MILSRANVLISRGIQVACLNKICQTIWISEEVGLMHCLILELVDSSLIVSSLCQGVSSKSKDMGIL